MARMSAKQLNTLPGHLDLSKQIASHQIITAWMIMFQMTTS